MKLYCIVHLPIKLIMGNYPNRPKTYKLDNLVLMEEAQNNIGINSGVINFYTFLHADL